MGKIICNWKRISAQHSNDFNQNDLYIPAIKQITGFVVINTEAIMSWFVLLDNRWENNIGIGAAKAFAHQTRV